MRSRALALLLFACLFSPASALAASATRTLVGASPDPAAVGQAVTITAEVDSLGGGAPTGKVTFTDGTRTLGAALLSLVGAGKASFAAGGLHSCALSTTGLKCWGFNGFGELGDGSVNSRSTPVQVTGLASGVLAVAAGSSHSCAIAKTAGLLCWGYNTLGALGDGTTNTRVLPIPVAGFATGDVVQIAAGGLHSCATTRAGAAFCWGAGGFGQLGDGAKTDRLTRRAVADLASGVRAVAAGLLHSCALTTAGAVKCWGSNGFSQLGDGSGTERLKPVAVRGLSSGALAISTSGHTTCAITASGAPRCWGRNWYGGLGDGTALNRNQPVGVLGLSGPVVSVAAGLDHSCAVTVAGAVQCWGRNDQGQLGDGTRADRWTAVQVVGLTNAAVAVAVGDYHSCALLRTGAVKCWGLNTEGELGDGTTTPRLTPARTLSLAALVRGRAKISTTTLGAGAHVLKATYAGDAAHSGSTGAAKLDVR